MPFEINLGDPPIGYAVTSARVNEQVQVSCRDFTSTEDGQHLIQLLEDIPSTILRSLPTEILPSSLDHLLAICRHDGTATVFVNELVLQLVVRATRQGKAGDAVSKDDIADVERLELGVQVPQDAGFLFIFSIGWRKGLYYDFEPLAPNRGTRPYDIARVLGQAYCHVLFQERFSISESEWTQLLEAKWFPFVGLRNQTIEKLMGTIRSGWDPDEMLDDVLSEIKCGVPQMLDSWRSHSSLLPHIQILERAVAHFVNGDPISCSGLLYPRIEGILRTYNNSLGTPIAPNQDNLSKLAVAAKVKAEKCLLLPRRFHTYLQDVYFANFDPKSQTIDVSRNSVGHGVASVSSFDQKAAVIGILIVNQLSYFLDAGRTLQTQDATKEVENEPN